MKEEDKELNSYIVDFNSIMSGNSEIINNLRSQEHLLKKELAELKEKLNKTREEIRKLEIQIYKAKLLINGNIEMQQRISSLSEKALKQETNGPYSNKTIIEAATDILLKNNYPMKVQDICKALIDGGMVSTTDDKQFVKTVSGTLHRVSHESHGRIVKEKRGVWKIKESVT